ncbi:MAG: hypothetical protein SGILL_008353 [Bacillariaceae sp.]
MTNATWLKHVMLLPKLSETKFEVRPDQEMDPKIVEEEYNKIWQRKSQLKDFELDLSEQDEEDIKNGIPTVAMAEAAKESMRWNLLIQSGICTPTYANEKFIVQLNNLTLVAVLLAAIATAALLSHPNFMSPDTSYPHPIPMIFQGLYATTMIASAIYCFAAAGIALHSVNRISNVCPSKTSVSYMTINVFFNARDAVNSYVFRGTTTMCSGLIVAFTWSNQNLWYGIPALIIATGCTIWFIQLWRAWARMTEFHSDIADKLCAKDLELAAIGKQSVTEGIWTLV